MCRIKNFDDLSLLMTVPEIGEVLGISKNNAYFLVKSKGFPAIKIGRQYRIPREHFINWLNSETKNAVGF